MHHTNSVNIIHYRGGKISLHSIYKEIVGCVWFLKTLFICHLVFYTAKITQIRDGILFATTWSFLLVVPYGETLLINFLYFFFWVGYFLQKYKQMLSHLSLHILIVSTFIFCIIVLSGNALPPDKVNTYMLENNFGTFAIQLLAGLSGSLIVIESVYFIYTWCNQYGGKAVLSIVQKIAIMGKYTLGIYVVQTLLLERIATNFLQISAEYIPNWCLDYFFVPTLGLLFCQLSFFIIKKTKRYRYIDILFYGGQK